MKILQVLEIYSKLILNYTNTLKELDEHIGAFLK